MTKERFIAVCEECGWQVNEFHDGYDISQYSPAGEDFSFSVGKDDPAEGVYNYVDDFDVDEHVEFWLPSRGKNGVPSSISILLQDAENIQEMLEELSFRLEMAEEE